MLLTLAFDAVHRRSDVLKQFPEVPPDYPSALPKRVYTVLTLGAEIAQQDDIWQLEALNYIVMP